MTPHENRARLEALRAQDERDARIERANALYRAMRRAERLAHMSQEDAREAARRFAINQRMRSERMAREPLGYLDVVRVAHAMGYAAPSPQAWREARAKVASGIKARA